MTFQTNTALATQNDICTLSYACHAICTLSPLHADLTMRVPKNTQEHRSKVLHLARKMTIEVSKVLRQPREIELIFRKPCRSIAPVTQTTFHTFVHTSKCNEASRLPGKTTLEPAWKPSKMKGFAASPKDMATPRDFKKTRA